MEGLFILILVDAYRQTGEGFEDARDGLNIVGNDFSHGIDIGSLDDSNSVVRTKGHVGFPDTFYFG